MLARTIPLLLVTSIASVPPVKETQVEIEVEFVEDSPGENGISVLQEAYRPTKA